MRRFQQPDLNAITSPPTPSPTNPMFGKRRHQPSSPALTLVNSTQFGATVGAKDGAHDCPVGGARARLGCQVREAER